MEIPYQIIKFDDLSHDLWPGAGQPWPYWRSCRTAARCQMRSFGVHLEMPIASWRREIAEVGIFSMDFSMGVSH